MNGTSYAVVEQGVNVWHKFAVSNMIRDNLPITLQLIPLVALVTVLQARQYGVLNSKILILAVAVAAIAMVVLAIDTLGY